jgi:hypothetical protein
LQEKSSNQEWIVLQKEENMAEEEKRWYRRRSATLVGPIWFIGWLFTIGYANLFWWQILLAIVVWPYFLGRAVGG